MRKASVKRALTASLGSFFVAACVGSLGVLSTSNAYCADGDVLVAGFNGSDYDGWMAEGEAFGEKPAPGKLGGQMNVSGFEGAGLVNSFYGGDVTTGTLTSPEVEICRPYINFLIGGGGVAGLAFDLIVDGEVVRHAVGPNTQPGGSEALDWATWDVTDLQGKKAIFRITDSAVGGWGHINVDEITFSSKKRAGMENVREAEVTSQYLIVPVRHATPERWVRIEVEGKTVREFTAGVALRDQDRELRDFDAYVDMGEYLGKKCRFIIEKAEEDWDFGDLTFADEFCGGVDSYNEKYRPQFHFSPRYGWTNDPNGLTFYNGEYHLFFQHNPFNVAWGNMTWGHATSPDLMHWTEKGDALYPDPLGTIFSGSGAVDFNNTTGFQTDPNGLPPFVVMYTCNGPNMRYGAPASQNLAYSVDGGKTFTKFEGNPTLPHIVGGNRDPKIFWHEPTGKWVVALYLDGEDYALFGSKDLKSWELLCNIEKLGCSECPDIFELPVDGDENNKMYVFWGGNGKYLLGNFDGQNFERLSEPLDAKWGGHDYAAQSYSDTPGRRIQFSWMNGGSYPGMPFNQQYTVPRELTLRTTPDGVRLCVNPVKEVAELRVAELALNAKTDGAATVYEPTAGESKAYDLLDYELTLEPGDSTIVVEARGRRVELDPKAGTTTYEDVVAPLAVVDGKITLRIVLDRTSFEIFVNDGLSQIAKCFVPEDENNAPVLRVENAKSVDAKCWTMPGCWN